jgi:hypothetical protein
MVRGLLCGACNTLVACLEGLPHGTAERAISYIDNARDQAVINALE